MTKSDRMIRTKASSPSLMHTNKSNPDLVVAVKCAQS